MTVVDIAGLISGAHKGPLACPVPLGVVFLEEPTKGRGCTGKPIALPPVSGAGGEVPGR